MQSTGRGSRATYRRVEIIVVLEYTLEMPCDLGLIICEMEHGQERWDIHHEHQILAERYSREYVMGDMVMGDL